MLTADGKAGLRRLARKASIGPVPAEVKAAHRPARKLAVKRKANEGGKAAKVRVLDPYLLLLPLELLLHQLLHQLIQPQLLQPQLQLHSSSPNSRHLQLQLQLSIRLAHRAFRD